MNNRKLRLFLVGFIVLVLIGVSASLTQTGDRPHSEASGVLVAPPPGYKVLRTNQSAVLSVAEVARKFQAASQSQQGVQKFAIHLRKDGEDIVYLLNLQEDYIRQTTKNSYGTIIQTTWQGSASQRLQQCSATGSFDAQGLEPSTSKNLYH